MSILFRLSILFWTPFILFSLLLIQIGRKISDFIRKGYLTPETFWLFRKTGITGVIWLEDLHEYIISSITKGDKKMGRIFGLKTDTFHEFIPKGQDDVPAEERLTFLCRFLDVRTTAEITDQIFSAKGFGAKREELLRAGTQEIKVLRKGLVGWKNFFYEDGTEVEWESPQGVSLQKAEAIMDRNLDKIPPEKRGEIAEFIRGQSSPDQD